MNKIINDPKLKSIVLSLQEKLQELIGNSLDKIYLFGSYSVSQANDTSDIDFLIITSDSNAKQYEGQLIDIAVDISLEYDCVLSLFITSSDEFRNYKDVKPLYKNINKEGIEIYAA